jgi:hypothetical protein
MRAPCVQKYTGRVVRIFQRNRAHTSQREAQVPCILRNIWELQAKLGR